MKVTPNTSKYFIPNQKKFDSINSNYQSKNSKNIIPYVDTIDFDLDYAPGTLLNIMPRYSNSDNQNKIRISFNGSYIESSESFQINITKYGLGGVISTSNPVALNDNNLVNGKFFLIYAIINPNLSTIDGFVAGACPQGTVSGVSGSGTKGNIYTLTLSTPTAHFVDGMRVRVRNTGASPIQANFGYVVDVTSTTVSVLLDSKNHGLNLTGATDIMGYDHYAPRNVNTGELFSTYYCLVGYYQLYSNEGTSTIYFTSPWTNYRKFYNQQTIYTNDAVVAPTASSWDYTPYCSPYASMSCVHYYVQCLSASQTLSAAEWDTVSNLFMRNDLLSYYGQAGTYAERYLNNSMALKIQFGGVTANSPEAYLYSVGYIEREDHSY